MILDTIIKNLCCAAIKGATINLLTGSAGDRNQSLIAFFQSVDALVHITPHPPELWHTYTVIVTGRIIQFTED